MFCRLLLGVAVGLAVVIVSGNPVAAQAPGGRYTSPSGPTISPYLDYFRRDNGVLNPYYNFVRPKVQLNQAMRDMNNQIQQQGDEQKKLTKDMGNMFKPSAAASTGSAATFNNLSHFYPSAGASTQTQRR